MSITTDAVPTTDSSSSTTARWTAATAVHSWDIDLECGPSVFSPGTKAIDSIVSSKSIRNMLRKLYGVEVNKAGNLTCLFKFTNGLIKVVGFIKACEGVDAEDMLIHLRNVEAVAAPMTAEEMENEFNL